MIDGIAYMMSPGPLRIHQWASGNLYIQIRQFLRGKPCEVYAAPFDVRLNPNEADDIVLQPDIIVVCDKSKLDDKACNGAPDMVIEILSPSTERLDKLIKFRKYQEYGVREYWIVDAANKMVHVHVLNNGIYFIKAYSEQDKINVHVLEGCVVDLSEVFFAE